MSQRRALNPQFDLFFPYVADLSLRDQRETMERPCFSLAKRKRLKPIEYVSPNGEVFINVYPNPEFGMATIWDADILIWAASVITGLRNRGVNDIPRTLSFQPYDLLRTIQRKTGGREYHLLREGLQRLQATTVRTNIRVQRGKKERSFSWIDEFSDLIGDDGESRGMSLTLANWFYEGIMMDGGLLSVDPEYFTITGGRERWLYRVARKHAGGGGKDGFAISLPTLFEKSGAEGTYRRFKFEIQAVATRNTLPSYRLSIEGDGKGEPSLRMVRRDDAEADVPPPRPKATKGPQQLAMRLADDTLERVRRDFPGWDMYALKAEFDAWVAAKSGRQPDDYQAAFYGFVRRYAKDHKE